MSDIPARIHPHRRYQREWAPSQVCFDLVALMLKGVCRNVLFLDDRWTLLLRICWRIICWRGGGGSGISCELAAAWFSWPCAQVHVVTLVIATTNLTFDMCVILDSALVEHATLLSTTCRNFSTKKCFSAWKATHSRFMHNECPWKHFCCFQKLLATSLLPSVGCSNSNSTPYTSTA